MYLHQREKEGNEVVWHLRLWVSLNSFKAVASNSLTQIDPPPKKEVRLANASGGVYILNYIVYNTIYKVYYKDSMIDQQKVSVFKDLFTQAESVLVIYASDALRDHLFAATALYKTFQQLGNREVVLLSSEDLSKIETDIAYLEETKTEVGHKNLCISFDYLKDSVEKITSSIDEDAKKLHITIKPKKGVAPLSKENVSFSYTGAEADMVILVGVDDLATLEQLYLGYENLYQSTALVSINSYETPFGNLKLDILGSSCVSEYVAELIKSLSFQIDHEAATNLLAGIDEETDNLESYLATADTFEVVSYLLRNGARRFARKQQTEDSEESNALEKQEVLSEDLAPNTETPVYLNQTVKVSQEVEDGVFIITESTPQSSSSSDRKTSSTDTENPEKRRRGRPKGSKNRVKTAPETKPTAKDSENKPKPGDLNYTPSGFGPSSS